MTMTLYTHPDCERHELQRHPERPERLRAVMDRLIESGLTNEMQVHLAEEIDDASIARVHTPEHIETINGAEPSTQVVRLDPDTYMSPGSLRAAKLAAGACSAAVNEVLDGEARRAFCAVRPPGHHAELSVAMGFCLFNNIAIAAETALQHPKINRVAIVDFDVHQCNGTIDIFKDRPEVLVCSSFQDNFYPHRYLNFANEHVINTPLNSGAGGDDFRRAITEQWLPAIDSHKPDMLLVSAGFDAHTADPLGELQLVDADYRWVTEQLIESANRYCQGRLISTLEGGYDLNALAGSVETHVATLAVG
ncbi:MAG: histone deacetylase family protein [Gammaproteobacteria bacterium]|nr:histone deacetylase family protein [Gammaproteobacteria bacterium]